MTWDVKIVYDAGVFVEGTPGVSPVFQRNKPTVDDDGAPVAANQRRFAKRPIGVAGAVTWQPTSFQLGPAGRLFASGPNYEARDPRLLVGDNQQQETTYIYQYDPSGGEFLQISSKSWSTLPGATPGAGGQKYRMEGACVWYGLIILYMQRFESNVAKGISLFYSQDSGNSWLLVPNGHVPPNLAAAGADSGGYRGREWSAPEPFPAGGIDSAGAFSKTVVYFPWTDYMVPNPPSPVSPKGYQVGLFRATRPNESAPWIVEPNRVIAERWEPAISTAILHGHTAHTVTGGVVVWYGDTSPNNGADFIGLGPSELSDGAHHRG